MKFVAELLTPKQKSAIVRAIQNPDLRPILFGKAVGVQWFDAFEKAGFLVPADIPPPVPSKDEGYVNIPVWPITDYLVATSDQLRNPENEEYAKKFLEFIRAATLYARDKGFGNYRVWWKFSEALEKIPPHLINLKDLNLFEYWLDDKYERGLVAENIGERWVVDLLDRNDAHCNTLAIQVLELLYRVHFLDKQYGASDRKEAALRFDSWNARKITQKVAAKAGYVLGRKAVEVFRAGLEKIIKTLNNDRWSSLWRSAIEDHKQNHSVDDPEDIFVEGMRDALLAFVSEMPEEALIYVSELLESPFQTIKRIAIYAIDRRYLQLSGLTGRVISNEYFTNNFRHEMWHLIHNHYSDFSAEDRAQVLDIIFHFFADRNLQKYPSASVYECAIWLKAIHEYSEKEERFYQDCIKIVGGEPENPDFSSYMTSGSVDHKSPIPLDELLAMGVDELVDQLLSYKDPENRDPRRFLEPVGLEGLTKALRQVVKSAPARYFAELHKFSSLDLAFIYEILEAYGELWTKKTQLPWEEIWRHLLEFCEEIISQERFWSPESVRERSQFVANRYWVIGSIARLIKNGTRSDDHAFSEKYLDRARLILLVLLEKEKGEEFTPDSDAVSISINSPRGQCIEAFINFSLRCCRLENKEKSDHIETWKRLEPTYNSELMRSENGEYEFATLVVNYLPNFFYMSKDWVMRNLDRIFDEQNYQKWLCAMNGYAYVSTVYRGIYDHLKKNGHFIRALDDANLKKGVAEKIVQNIVIAYVDDFEVIDDKGSLIDILIERRNSSELSQLIWFFWTLRGGGDTKIRRKAFELWPRLLAVIDASSREGRKLVSRLSTWSIFVDEINEENKNLLLATVGFADEDYNSADLLEMIARISEKQPLDVYEIWSKFLEKSNRDFPEEAVKVALKNLAGAGAGGLRNAKAIASMYLKAGNKRPFQWLQEFGW